ncbi:HAD family hydrolase (plasmid) [Natrinema zhouii]|uniref:HAD family hydrolase n=1 Tax=Natrinema zhouii TaxID=1710539 RepID=UPI001CFF7E10|nr:HAD family hydrolase [Natrinema zhouii]UHQ98104.1 HAD family hydrolase [Natrinema zhouii]
MGISTVLLDLDDTICKHPQTTQDLLQDAFDAASVDPFFDATAFESLIPEIDADSTPDLRERCFKRLAEDANRDPRDALAVANAFEDPEPTAVEFLPGAEASLEQLASNYRLGLVTNGDRMYQRAKLDTLGIHEYFDVTTYAEPGRSVKPDPNPFYRTLDTLSATPDEAVHIGNSLRSDVVGAQAAGVTAVWLARKKKTVETITPEYSIESMRDLRAPPWV